MNFPSMKTQAALTLLCGIIRRDGPPAARGVAGMLVDGDQSLTVSGALQYVRDTNPGVRLLQILQAVGPEGHVSFVTTEDTLNAELVCEGTGWQKKDFESEDIEDLLEQLLDVAVLAEPEPSEPEPSEPEPSEPEDDDASPAVITD